VPRPAQPVISLQHSSVGVRRARPGTPRAGDLEFLHSYGAETLLQTICFWGSIAEHDSGYVSGSFNRNPKPVFPIVGSRGTSIRMQQIDLALDSISNYFRYMKTTIDIPEKELEDAMTFSGATSKREAVVTALREFNRRNRMARLVGFSGTCDFDTNIAIETREADEATEART